MGPKLFHAPKFGLQGRAPGLVGQLRHGKALVSPPPAPPTTTPAAAVTAITARRAARSVAAIADVAAMARAVGVAGAEGFGRVQTKRKSTVEIVDHHLFGVRKYMINTDAHRNMNDKSSEINFTIL